MKATDASVHGILPKVPGAGGGDDAPAGDGAEKRAQTLKEFFEAGQAGDFSGADTAMHSYYTQCEAEEPADEDEAEPEDDSEDNEE